MPAYFDIEVSLSTVYPLIWRRFLLRSTGTTFADLHRAIQDACGWWDYHLYRFDEATDVGLIGLAQSPVAIEEDVDDEDDTPAADGVPLAGWVGESCPRACRYQYDFGDEWDHDVIVRGVVERGDRFFRRLIGGERSFPKEDCGSMSGFERILAFRRTGVDPEGEDEDLGEWLGDWQPDADIEKVRAAFDSARKPRNRQ